MATVNWTTQACYELRVAGHLSGERWSRWFGGLHVSPQADGTTMLSGVIADQAELHGLLDRMRDVGLVLIALRRV
jgi:hypothetical protein